MSGHIVKRCGWPVVTKKPDINAVHLLFHNPEMTETPLEFKLKTGAFVLLHKCDAVYFTGVKYSSTVNYLECLPGPIQK